MSKDNLDNVELAGLSGMLRDGVEIKDRKYRLRTYEKCFVGSEACGWLIKQGLASDVPQAIVLGDLMIQQGLFHHVLREQPFKNEQLFYRFSDDEDHGQVDKSQGAAASWHSLVSGELFGNQKESLMPEIPDYSEEIAKMTPVDTLGVSPLDEHNAKLLDNVHPKEWKDPVASGTYDVVVIGAGSGGLVTAAASAGVGAKVALIEEHLMGGDCLNFGCVPSKALLRSAKVAKTVRESAHYGVHIEGMSEEEFSGKVKVDFPKVMKRLRGLRADISKHDASARFADEFGIDVFMGRGVFTGPNSVEINGQTLNFKKACIATGGRPGVPPIPGLDSVPFYTNMNLFNLTELPKRLGVVGTGVIGVEMAQAFQRFGSEVTLFSRRNGILPKEDPEASAVVLKSLKKDGVKFVTGARYKEVRKLDDDKVVMALEDGSEYEFDALLVATGRKPNVSGLGLDVAGVDSDPGKGIIVDDNLRTSAKHIFAVGDVATKYQFTHAADFMARIVVRNALFFGSAKFSDLIIPWCTYTEPEIAHVGLYEADLEKRGTEYQTFVRHFAEVDRSVLEEQTDGFVKVHVQKGSDQILGATIVGHGAGDMINEMTLAMQSGTGLSKIANVIHPYPTASEAVRQIGDQYNKTRMTPMVRKLLRGLIGLQ